MIDRKHKRKPIILFIIWCLSCLIFTGYNKYGSIIRDTQKQSQSNIPIFITLLAIVLYFLPMLILINRQARIVSLKWLILVTKILFIFFSSISGIFMIALIFL